MQPVVKIVSMLGVVGAMDKNLVPPVCRNESGTVNMVPLRDLSLGF